MKRRIDRRTIRRPRTDADLAFSIDGQLIEVELKSQPGVTVHARNAREHRLILLTDKAAQVAAEVSQRQA